VRNLRITNSCFFSPRVLFCYILRPGQTIATCQRNISQHCWAQHFVCVWAPCCGVLRRVGCCWLKFECCDMLRCHFAIVWPGLNVITSNVLNYCMRNSPPWLTVWFNDIFPENLNRLPANPEWFKCELEMNTWLWTPVIKDAHLHVPHNDLMDFISLLDDRIVVRYLQLPANISPDMH